jgi:hypothetical protein
MATTKDNNLQSTSSGTPTGTPVNKDANKSTGSVPKPTDKTANPKDNTQPTDSTQTKDNTQTNSSAQTNVNKNGGLNAEEAGAGAPKNAGVESGNNNTTLTHEQAQEQFNRLFEQTLEKRFGKKVDEIQQLVTQTPVIKKVGYIPDKEDKFGQAIVHLNKNAPEKLQTFLKLHSFNVDGADELTLRRTAVALQNPEWSKEDVDAEIADQLGIEDLELIDERESNKLKRLVTKDKKYINEILQSFYPQSEDDYLQTEEEKIEQFKPVSYTQETLPEFVVKNSKIVEKEALTFKVEVGGEEKEVTLDVDFDVDLTEDNVQFVNNFSAITGKEFKEENLQDLKSFANIAKTLKSLPKIYGAIYKKALEDAEAIYSVSTSRQKSFRNSPEKQSFEHKKTGGRELIFD